MDKQSTVEDVLNEVVEFFLKHKAPKQRKTAKMAMRAMRIRYFERLRGFQTSRYTFKFDALDSQTTLSKPK